MIENFDRKFADRRLARICVRGAVEKLISISFFRTMFKITIFFS